MRHDFHSAKINSFHHIRLSSPQKSIKPLAPTSLRRALEPEHSQHVTTGIKYSVQSISVISSGCPRPCLSYRPSSPARRLQVPSVEFRWDLLLSSSVSFRADGSWIGWVGGWNDTGKFSCSSGLLYFVEFRVIQKRQIFSQSLIMLLPLPVIPLLSYIPPKKFPTSSVKSIYRFSAENFSEKSFVFFGNKP